MLNIDGFAYSNRLRHVHPAEKTAFALLTMVLCLGFSSPVISCLVIALMAVAVIRAAGIPVKIYLKLMSLPFSFLLVGVLTIAVSVTTRGPAVEWLGSVTISGVTAGVTPDSLITAAELFLKSLGSVSCMYFLALTTPVVELASVMRKLRFPSLFIELTELIYRFIFVMLETANDIYTSQSSRWGYASLKNSMKSLGQLTATLFIRALHRSRMLFTTLSARGYTGQLNVLVPEYPVSATNIILIAVIELTLIITAVFLEVGKIGRLYP